MKTLYSPVYDRGSGEVISWEEISGKSLKDIYSKMCKQLDSETRRTRSAYATRSNFYTPVIICSLYPGMSRIRSKKVD